MAIKLNKAGYQHAESIVKKGVEVNHISNNWDEVKPDADDKIRYLDSHTLDEYGLWFLGIDSSASAKSNDKFVYPFGDFNVLQESALVLAQEQAKKKNHADIAKAAEALLKKIEQNFSKKK